MLTPHLAAQKLTFPDALLPLYIAFLAWDKFTATHSSSSLSLPLPPGTSPSSLASDTEKLTSIALALAEDLVRQASHTVDPDDWDAVKTQLAELAQELARAGGGELHNVGALTGGMVSQEVIKVVTEQYVPVDNTCVFDGVRSRSGVVRV